MFHKTCSDVLQKYTKCFTNSQSLLKYILPNGQRMTVFFIFEALYARFGEINLESRIFRKQEVGVCARFTNRRKTTCNDGFKCIIYIHNIMSVIKIICNLFLRSSADRAIVIFIAWLIYYGWNWVQVSVYIHRYDIDQEVIFHASTNVDIYLYIE